MTGRRVGLHGWSSADYQRRGDYLGKTVQIVPHLTNAVQEWIERVAKIPVDETGEEPDVCVIEVSFAISQSGLVRADSSQA